MGGSACRQQGKIHSFHSFQQIAHLLFQFEIFEKGGRGGGVVYNINSLPLNRVDKAVDVYPKTGDCKMLALGTFQQY